ncbi:MAG: tetratricopeptide repeat protein [Verrucomicrobia bacterium]|nr:tetratricopeptide repeat protein [Verrucomicrobiota bacterium]
MPVPVTSQDPSQHTGPKDSIWNRRWIILLGGALLAGCLFAAYHNTFAVPYLLDDADSIEKNKTIRSLATAFFPPTNSGITVSGRPLLNLSLAINYRLGGTGLFGYHLGNLLIHFAAALSLFGVIRRTLQLPAMAARYGKHATLLAWFSAALWALHPLQTESVTYIIQRAESLVGLCYLFTLYAFIRAVEKPSRLWPTITIIACLLGMAAKEVMATAPLILLLYDRTFVSGTFAESWQRRGPLYLALAATWGVLLALVISSGGRGTSVGYSAVSWLDYLLTQGPGITTYLAHSFFPANLIFDYGAVVEMRPLVLAGGILTVATLLAVTVILLVKKPKAGFFGAWFFLILAPTSSIIPVATQTLADHRMYVPLAALVVGLVLLIHQTSKRYYWSLLALLAAVLGIVTFQRNASYRSNISIWEDTVQKVPDNARALNNLGSYYLAGNRIDEAIIRFSEALKFVPNYPFANCNLGRALIYKETETSESSHAINDLADGIRFRHTPTTVANEYGAAGNKKIEEGLALLEKAVRAEPTNSFFLAHYGNALLSLKQPEAAVAQLEKAVALEPGNHDMQYNLANALARIDQNERAAVHFQIALRLKPDDAETLTNYGALLRRMNRISEAIDRLENALRLNPNSARTHSNLGVALLEAERTDEAIAHLKEALRLDSNIAQARYNLSNALAETGHTEEAITHLEALLKKEPPTAELLSNLGVLYARAGRLDEALVQTKRALEIDPSYRAAQENFDKISAYIRNHPNG